MALYSSSDENSDPGRTHRTEEETEAQRKLSPAPAVWASQSNALFITPCPIYDPFSCRSRTRGLSTAPSPSWLWFSLSLSCLKPIHLLFVDARGSDVATAAPGLGFPAPVPLGLRAGSQTTSTNDIRMTHQRMAWACCWAQGPQGQGPFLTISPAGRSPFQSPALGRHPNIQTDHNLTQVLLNLKTAHCHQKSSLKESSSPNDLKCIRNLLARLTRLPPSSPIETGQDWRTL